MEALCRICFEGQEEGRALRRPCRCTGTIGAIHEYCLGRWLDVQPAATRPRCELCRTPYLFLYDEPWEDIHYANALCSSLWSNIGFHFFTQYALLTLILFLNIHLNTYTHHFIFQFAYHAAYIAGFGLLSARKVDSSKWRYAQAFFNTERRTFCAAYCIIWLIAAFHCTYTLSPPVRMSTSVISNWGWTVHGEGNPTLALIAAHTFLSLLPYFHYNTLCVLNQSRTRRLLDWLEN